MVAARVGETGLKTRTRPALHKVHVKGGTNEHETRGRYTRARSSTETRDSYTLRGGYTLGSGRVIAYDPAGLEGERSNPKRSDLMDPGVERARFIGFLLIPRRERSIFEISRNEEKICKLFRENIARSRRERELSYCIILIYTRLIFARGNFSRV